MHAERALAAEASAGTDSLLYPWKNLLFYRTGVLNQIDFALL